MLMENFRSRRLYECERLSVGAEGWCVCVQETRAKYNCHGEKPAAFTNREREREWVLIVGAMLSASEEKRETRSTGADNKSNP